MKKPVRTLLSAFLVGSWAFFAVPALAQTSRYVSPSGTDSGTCPAGAPCATVDFALAAADPGDVIHLAPGTYHQQVTIGKPITLKGAGAGADPSAHTILTGHAPALSGRGISISAGVTDVTIQDLRVQRFEAGSGIFGHGGNHRLTVLNVQVYHNTGGTSADAGIHLNGPISHVLLHRIDARYNSTRGIVIWNGQKHHISITDCTISNNHFSGLELQDGTASGVTVTGNVIENNTDCGLALVGLTAGAGPNLIAQNTITDNGRFGIEVKLPNGSGLETGDGSIVLTGNTVRRTGPIAATEARDLAGIAVYRRSWTPDNPDIPQGVVVKGNTVSGYRQPGVSEGFGIVVEGTGMTVAGNQVSDCEVGIQAQAGHTPYAALSPLDGEQSAREDQYFGRGNSPVFEGSLQANTFAGNTANIRYVGVPAPVEPIVEEQTPAGQAAEIALYPNPAHGSIQVKMAHLAHEEKVTAELYNSLGKLLLRQEIAPVRGRQQELKLPALPRGIYSVRLRVGQELVYRKIMVE